MSLQVRRAHALAEAHHHEWAFVLPESVAVAAHRIGGWALVRQLVDEARPDGGLPGIARPSVDDAGIVHHLTGTGRLEWWVDGDGTVTLLVSRPSGGVLSAVIEPAGKVHIGSFDVESAPFHQRHVGVLSDAIEAALRPCGGTWVTLLPEPWVVEHFDGEAPSEAQEMAARAVQHLWAVALPDVEPAGGEPTGDVAAEA